MRSMADLMTIPAKTTLIPPGQERHSGVMVVVTVAVSHMRMLLEESVVVMAPVQAPVTCGGAAGWAAIIGARAATTALATMRVPIISADDARYIFIGFPSA